MPRSKATRQSSPPPVRRSERLRNKKKQVSEARNAHDPYVVGRSPRKPEQQNATAPRTALPRPSVTRSRPIPSQPTVSVSTNSLPAEIFRKILFHIPPSDLPELLVVSKNFRRMFRPGNWELAFAEEHLKWHASEKKGEELLESEYVDYLLSLDFQRLPHVYALTTMFGLKEYREGQLLPPMELLSMSRIWCGGNFQSSNMSAEAKVAWRLWIERLFTAALALPWEITNDSVALGGRATEKNRFLEILSGVAVTVESPKAVRLVLELVQTKISYRFARLDNGSARAGAYTQNNNKGQASQTPLPDLLHVMLFQSCCYYSDSIAHFLLDKFPEHFKGLMGPMRYLDYDYTLFTNAARLRDKRVLQRLLSIHAQGKTLAASPNQPQYDPDLSFGPLHEVKYADLARLLLLNGADPNGAGPNGFHEGNTPLAYRCLYARSSEDLKVLQVLLEHGANPNSLGASGSVLLHEAARVATNYSQNPWKIEVARTLLEAGADPNIQDANGRTPLHVACMKANDIMINLLVRYGANMMITDDNGLTPLAWIRRVERRSQEEMRFDMDEMDLSE
ncbi:hypothetical protein HDU96_010785 [Phlyctochytrium bullatum]|nr:hypothetical protein HDU96_010785 [Phlyctochytrium bullatum]